MATEPTNPPEPTPTHECDCENICCPRCRRRLLIGKALEEGSVSVHAYLEALNESDVAPDGYPWEDDRAEEYLG